MSTVVSLESRASHLVVAFAAAMMSGCRREARSKGQALEAMAEVRGVLGFSMVGGARTQIGQKLQRLSAQAQELQREFQFRLSAMDADALLKPERLSTPEGVERSMRDAEALRQLDRWYFNQVERLLLEFDVWALEQFGRSLGEQARLRLEARDMLERSIAVHESITTLLRFVKASSPRLEGGILVFESKTLCLRYESLLKAMETRSQMLEMHQIELLRRRRASMDS